MTSEPPREGAVDRRFAMACVGAGALVLLGLVACVTPRTRWLTVAATAFGLGIALFCGSIYAMTFGAPRALGMVAPLGGLSFMAGWACLALHAWKGRRWPVAGGR